MAATVPTGQIETEDGEDAREIAKAELGREPTHNETFVYSGRPLTMGSSNVKEIWWNYRNQKLFIRFLDEALYVYNDVPISTVIGFIETDSPGRYVWNVIRPQFGDGTKIAFGNGKRTQSQVVRIVRKNER